MGFSREEKRKCRSPIRVTKRRKIEDGFNDLSIVGSGNAVGFTLDSQGSSVNGSLILDQANCTIDTSDGCLNSIFNQLLWTLKYLKYNPFRTNEEMLQLIETLCEGLGKVIVLSRYCKNTTFTQSHCVNSFRLKLRGYTL